MAFTFHTMANALARDCNNCKCHMPNNYCPLGKNTNCTSVNQETWILAFNYKESLCDYMDQQFSKDKISL